LDVTAIDSEGNTASVSVVPSFSSLQVCKDEEFGNGEMGGDDSGSEGSASDSGGSGSSNDSQEDSSEGSDSSN